MQPRLPHPLFGGFVFGVVIGLWLVACSSGGPPSLPKSASKNPAAPTLGLGSTSAFSVATCAAKPDYGSCSSCCAGGDFLPVLAPQGNANAECLCKLATARCSTACAQTMCSDTSGGSEDGDASAGADALFEDPCSSCTDLSTDTSCAASGTTACNEHPACAAAMKCLVDAQCDRKSDPVSSADAGG
jgi:hypothetical protein